MTRFDSTFSQGIKKGGTNHHEGTAQDLNAHQQRGIKALSYYHERKEK